MIFIEKNLDAFLRALYTALVCRVFKIKFPKFGVGCVIGIGERNKGNLLECKEISGVTVQC